MNQLLCESPVIIRNPKLQSLLLLCGGYHTPYLGDVLLSQIDRVLFASNFPKWRFSPKRMRVTSENIGQFYVFDPETGVFYPMFIEVLCGHCALCRDKKTRDWKFRALCESIESPNTTYFVTLTYNNKYYPRYGVHKEAIQLFMKRLRIKLSRLGIEHNIKYFAVGEYGKNSGRPHYHLLLWNFPDDLKEFFPGITSVLHFIEECWSVYMRDDDGNWYYPDGSRTPAREPFGFAYCKPCDKGAYGYVMKYMRKQFKAPKGMNSTFYLASHFIGASYCERYKDFYRSHPEHLDISAVDPLLGGIVTVPLPSYFVNKYFPNISSQVPKPLRDAFSLFVELLNKRYSLLTAFVTSDEDWLNAYPTLTPSEHQVLDIYFPVLHGCDFGRLAVDYATFHRARMMTEKEIVTEYFSLTLELDTLTCVLLAGSHEFDSEFVKFTRLAKERRAASCDRWYCSRPSVDVGDLAHQKRVDLEKMVSREIL